MDERPRPDLVLERVASDGARGPSLIAVLAVAVVTLVVVVAKPWGSGAPSPVPDVRPPALKPLTSPTPVARATVDPADVVAARMCFAVDAWRVVAVADWDQQRVRTWIAAEGLDLARGDPRLRFTPVVARRVPALGFCAPATGADRPPADVRIDVWSLSRALPGPLEVTVREPSTRTPLVRLWWPPGGEAGGGGATWASGRYAITLTSRSSGYRRVLGVEVILVGSSPAPVPSTRS